jgi:hypothetical protein
MRFHPLKKPPQGSSALYAPKEQTVKERSGIEVEHPNEPSRAARGSSQ